MAIRNFDAARELMRRIDLDDDADAPVDTAAIGAIPGYDLEAKIGGGGEGEVYRARSTATGAIVAIKVLRRAVTERNDRAWREFSILSRLRPTCVPRILDFGLTGDRAYIVSEFVTGASLLEWCDAHDLSRTERVELLIKVAEAVQTLHECGIIHRDLKPSNVLVSNDGTPCLIDLGIAALHARDVHETIAPDGVPIGSPAYMAPEQARGERTAINVRSDLYALAATAYRVLTGTTPHSTDGGLHDVIRRAATETPRAPRSIDPTIDSTLDAIIMKGVAPQPSARYESAAAFAHDLQAWRDGEPTLARPLRGTARWLHLVRRSPVVATAATLLLLVAGAMLFLGARWALTRAPVITATVDANALDGVVFQSDYAHSALGQSAAVVPSLAGPGRDFLVVSQPNRPNQNLKKWPSLSGSVTFIPMTDLAAAANVTLVEPEASPWCTVSGVEVVGQFGRAVESLGDLDGDGATEIAVFAPGDEREDGVPPEIHVLFGGSAFAEPRAFDLEVRMTAREDDPEGELVRMATTGEVIPPLERMVLRLPEGTDGRIVNMSVLDDLTGDGIRELAVFTRGKKRDDTTPLYILDLDQVVQRGAEIEISASTAWLTIEPTPRMRTINAACTLGDLDGDGLRELVLGWDYHQKLPPDPEIPGAAIIIAGRDLTGGAFVIDDFAGATHFKSTRHGRMFGNAVANGGDLNDDGFDDLLIGASGIGSYIPDGGEAFIIFGSEVLLGRGDVLVEELAAPEAISFRGTPVNIHRSDAVGQVVAAAGDFNGDGIDDAAIIASRANNVGNDAGAVYIVLGRPDLPFVDTSELLTTDGFDLGITIRGAEKDDQLGTFVECLGDVNGDGADDLLVGAPGGAANGIGGSGEMYLIYGRPRWRTYFTE